MSDFVILKENNAQTKHEITLSFFSKEILLFLKNKFKHVEWILVKRQTVMFFEPKVR